MLLPFEIDYVHRNTDKFVLKRFPCHISKTMRLAQQDVVTKRNALCVCKGEKGLIQYINLSIKRWGFQIILLNLNRFFQWVSAVHIHILHSRANHGMT